MKRSGLCLLAVFSAALSVKSETVGLTNDKRLFVYDASGRIVSRTSLISPVKGDDYIAICSGDLVPENPGIEIAVLRKDRFIDIYPYKAGAESLKRLGYPVLKEYAGRIPYKLAAADVDPRSPGDELLVLHKKSSTESTTQYVYVYSCAGMKKVLFRNDYLGLSGGKEEFAGFGAITSLSWSKEKDPVMLTTDPDGTLGFHVSVGKKGVTRRLWHLNCKGPAATAAFFDGEKPVTTGKNSALQYFTATIPPKAGHKVELQDSSGLIDVTSVPDRKVVLKPAVKVNWTKTPVSGEMIADWKQLPVKSGKVELMPTPDGQLSCLKVESGKRNILPLNLALPEGTNSIGLWFKDHAGLTPKHGSFINKYLTFAVRINGVINLIKAHQIDNPTYVNPGHGFHPQAHFQNWALWQVYWEPGSGNAVLENIEISGGDNKTVYLSPLFAARNTVRPYAAENVWKLKNISKPGTRVTSLYHTADKYHEYIYSSRPYLRPILWDRYKPQEVVFILRSTLGMELAAYRISGQELAKEFIFPELPEATYIVEMDIFGINHRFIDSERMVLQVLQGDSKNRVKTAGIDLIPCRQLNRQESGPMGRALEPVEFKFRLSPELASRAVLCKWNQDDTESIPVAHGGVKLDGKKDFSFSLKSPRQGGYKLDMAFYDKQGAILYKSQVKYGVSAPVGKKISFENGKIAKEDGSPLMLSSIGSSFDPGQTFRLPQYTMPALINASVKGGNQVATPIVWYMLEPVKGVYNFYLVDRLLDMGNAFGGKSWVGVGCGGDNMPEWLWFEDYIAQDNRTVNHPYHYVTPMGERFSEAQKNINRALFERYKNDPRIGGWFFFAGPSEGFLTDCWTRIGDYSMASKRRFRVYLKQLYGDSLDRLNTAWKTKYATWNSIQPPLPDFTTEWESSVPWRDFINFKQNFVVKRLTELQKMLREIDPDRPALMYAKEGFGATGVLAPIFKKYKVRYSNGGGETTMSYVQSCIMNNFGVPVTCEGHWVMPEPGSVFCVMANSILAGNFAGNNIQCGLVWSKRIHDQVPSTQMIMHTTKAISAIADELNASVQTAPHWTGYYSSANALYTGRQFRLPGNQALNQLHDTAQQKLHIQESWVDDFTPVKILSKYPVIVDADSKIMTPESVKDILDYVKGGGILLAPLSMGKYMPGSAESLYQVAAGLGIKNISESKQQSGTVVFDRNDIHMRDLYSIKGSSVRLKPLASDAEGKTLLWQADYGKGKIIFSAGIIDFARSSEFLKVFLEKYAGKPPVNISADAPVQAGTVESKDAYFVVIRPVMPGNNVNASIEQMNALKKVPVTISGNVPMSSNTVGECIWNTRLNFSGDKIKFEAVPGTLYVVRIKK